MQNIRFYFDEAGRGPLAGPVSISLVAEILDYDCIRGLAFQDKIKDSKKISEKQRNIFFSQIINSKIIRSHKLISNKIIDSKGVSFAIQQGIINCIGQIFQKIFSDQIQVSLAFRSSLFESLGLLSDIDHTSPKSKIGAKIPTLKSIPNLQSCQTISFFQKIQKKVKIQVFLDGNHDFVLSKKYKFETHSIIKGDSKIPQISIASILAKVIRDGYMIDISTRFPKYKFAKHKGYGTAEHIALIQKYGLSKIHRKLFCRNFVS